MPKKVLVYAEVFYPQTSGYAHAFLQLIKNLLANQYQVDVVTPYALPEKEPELNMNGLQIIRYAPKLNVSVLGLFYTYYKLASKIKKLFAINSYQMVIIETGDQPLLPFFLPDAVLNKTAIRFHSTSDTEYLIESKQKKYRIKKWLWQNLGKHKVKHVWATNAYHLNYVQQHILSGIPIQSTQVVTNFVNAPAQSSNHPTNVPLRFFTLGRMDEEGYKQKGFDILFEALQQCKEDFIRTGATFTVVGNGSNYHKAVALSSNLPFVKIIPALSHTDVQQQLLQADVVVLPSIYEGVSMFALEALQYGNAVVFSNTGGLVDMVDGNGYLVAVGDVASLKNAMLNMLHNNQLDVMKQKSVAIALAKFNAQVQFSQFQNGVKKIVTNE